MDRRGLVLAAALLVYSPAQAFNKTHVFLSSLTEISVGTQFVFLLREGYIASQSFELVQSEKEAGIVVHISIIPVADGNQIAYSLAFTAGGYWVASTVGMCGIQMLQSCVAPVLAETNNAADIVRAVINQNHR